MTNTPAREGMPELPNVLYNAIYVDGQCEDEFNDYVHAYAVAYAAALSQPAQGGGDGMSAEEYFAALPHPQPARGEAVAWARQSGDPNDDAFVISAKVKRLWLASNPKRVARYTRPLYTTHVPCWALPAVESALSMLDQHGYTHTDLAAFRDWLKEKSQ